MSDFLGRLAARQLGTLPVLTPRLPSRFQPEPTGPAPAFEPAPDEGPAAAAHHETPRPRRVETIAAQRPPARPAPPRPVETAAAQRSPARPAETTVARNTLDERQVLGTATPAPPPPSPAPVPMAPEFEAVALPVPARTPAAAPAEGIAPLETPTAARLIEPMANERPPRPPATVEEEPPARATPPPAAASSRLLPPEQPARRPLTPPPPVRPAPASSSEAPEPVIHVTIGRLDVRATVAATPAPEPKPKPRNAVSLDDYLDRRSGRRA